MKRKILLTIGALAWAATSAKAAADTIPTAELDELVVTAIKKCVKPTSRGIKVDMADNPLSEIGSATEAIRQMPLIDASAGGINVVGKGTPVIYINGRLMRDDSELAILTSKDLDSVEIITNPSSKYGPEVSCVLLIKTRKRNQGTYANIGGTVTASDVMSESANGGLGIQMENGLNFFGNFSLSDSRFKQKREYHETVSLPSVGDEFTSAEESPESSPNPYCEERLGTSLTKAEPFNHTFSLMGSVGANYEFHGNSMGVKYTFTRTPFMHFDDRLSSYTNMLPETEISSQSRIFSQSERHLLNGYAYFSLSNSLDLNLDLDYVKNKSLSVNDTDEEQTATTIKNTGHTDADLYAAKIELEQRWEKFKLSVGADYTFTRNLQTFSSHAEGDAAAILLPATDDVTQRLYSGFLSFDWSLAEKWKFYGGLRYDVTRTRYVRNSEFQKALSKNYDDFLPNIGVNFSSPVTLNLYYKQAVYRPSYTSLDNNFTYVTPTHWESGNPALQRMKAHEMGLNLFYKKFILQGEWTHYNRKIGLICYYDPSIGASVTQTVNLPTYNMLQFVGVQRLDVNRWHPSLTGVMVFQNLCYGEPRRSYKTPFYQLSLNNRFDLPKSFHAYLSLFLRGTGNIETQYCGASWQAAVTLSKQYKDWNFSLVANDIFGTWMQKVTTHTNRVKYSYNIKGASQFVSLSVRYQFRAAKRQYKGKSVRDDEINRL